MRIIVVKLHRTSFTDSRLSQLILQEHNSNLVICMTLFNEDAYLTIVNLPQGPQNTQQIQEEQL